LVDSLFIEEGSGLWIPRGMLTVFEKRKYGTRRAAEEYESCGDEVVSGFMKLGWTEQ
jgi:hypothetical protein